MSPRNQFQALFNFQRNLCKKGSEKVCKLIWINFDSFTVTSDVNSLLPKFNFPIEVMSNSLQTQKGLGLAFTLQLL